MPFTGKPPFSGFSDIVAKKQVKPNPNDKSEGAYVLGDINDSGKFQISYVGRTKEDTVTERISSHTRSEKYCSYKEGLTPYGAYLLECKLYHYYKKQLAQKHPEDGDHKNWRCPVENCPDQKKKDESKGG